MFGSIGILGRVATAALLVSSCVSNGPSGEPPGAANPSSLNGTEWRAVSLTGVGEIDPAADVTLAFVDDGRVAGRAGCNQFSGPVTDVPDGIRLGPLALTKMACLDPELQQIESAYVAALESTRAFRIQDQQLVLTDLEGAELARLTRS